MSLEIAPLTTRQARFVEEFCVDFNATQAARRAGYSTEHARSIGNRLRTHPVVAAAIAQARAALKARCEASSDRWLLEILEVGYPDPDALAELLHDISDDARTIGTILHPVPSRRSLLIERSVSHLRRMAARRACLAGLPGFGRIQPDSVTPMLPTRPSKD
jgi:Terminase small subunit